MGRIFVSEANKRIRFQDDVVIAEWLSDGGDFAEAAVRAQSVNVSEAQFPAARAAAIIERQVVIVDQQLTEGIAGVLVVGMISHDGNGVKGEVAVFDADFYVLVAIAGWSNEEIGVGVPVIRRGTVFPAADVEVRRI